MTCPLNLLANVNLFSSHFWNELFPLLLLSSQNLGSPWQLQLPTARTIPTQLFRVLLLTRVKYVSDD